MFIKLGKLVTKCTAHFLVHLSCEQIVCTYSVYVVVSMFYFEGSLWKCITSVTLGE